MHTPYTTHTYTYTHTHSLTLTYLMSTEGQLIPCGLMLSYPALNLTRSVSISRLLFGNDPILCTVRCTYFSFFDSFCCSFCLSCFLFVSFRFFSFPLVSFRLFLFLSIRFFRLPCRLFFSFPFSLSLSLSNCACVALLSASLSLIFLPTLSSFIHFYFSLSHFLTFSVIFTPTHTHDSLSLSLGTVCNEYVSTGVPAAP
jgi:hypothetical protein